MKIYIVKQGDTMHEIARKYFVSVEELMQANPQMKDANAIEKGMKVKIPSGNSNAVNPFMQFPIPKVPAGAEELQQATITQQPWELLQSPYGPPKQQSMGPYAMSTIPQQFYGHPYYGGSFESQPGYTHAGIYGQPLPFGYQSGMTDPATASFAPGAPQIQTPQYAPLSMTGELPAWAYPPQPQPAKSAKDCGCGGASKGRSSEQADSQSDSNVRGARVTDKSSAARNRSIKRKSDKAAISANKMNKRAAGRSKQPRPWSGI